MGSLTDSAAAASLSSSGGRPRLGSRRDHRREACGSVAKGLDSAHHAARPARWLLLLLEVVEEVVVVVVVVVAPLLLV